MSDLLWYMHRLRRMPVMELPYRLEHWAKKKRDKYWAVPFIRSRCTQRCRIPRIDLSGVKEAIPDVRTRIAASAEDIRNHRFRIFGIERDFGDPIDWHLDPKTGNRWPLVFWGDIDYRDGRTIGGVKFAWELNRLQHLPLLAIAFQMTRDHRYKEELFNQLRSWMDGNPYPRGINWISGIEIAIRMLNLVYSLRLLGEECLDAGRWAAICEFVSRSGRHLYRYRSQYSSCANHAVAEALGLFAAGLCFPGIEDAAKWKRLGKSVLEREVTRQIYPDGSSFEHSVPYLQFVSELFLVYLLLCRDYGEPCSEEVKDRLKAAVSFLSGLTDGSGNCPRIGDGDDGCLLRLDAADDGNLLSLLNVGAVLFDHAGWIPAGADYDLMTFCLLGPDSKATWERLKRQAAARRPGVRRFPDAGLIAVRGEDGVLCVANGGRLGLEPLGGHGHADCLSFWLSVKGRPIVVDPGTYLYHSGGRWRAYFRGTAAHSTITIDEQDQAPILSDFMFAAFYRVQQVHFDDSEERVVWSVEHDGYTRLEDPLVHRRTFTYIRSSGEWIVEDLLSCKGSHKVKSLIHLHPECLVSLYGCSMRIRCGQEELTFELDRQWESIRLVCGQWEPLLGWYAPRFNEIHESPTVMCSASIQGTTRFTSIIRVGNAEAVDLPWMTRTYARGRSAAPMPLDSDPLSIGDHRLKEMS